MFQLRSLSFAVVLAAGCASAPKVLVTHMSAKSPVLANELAAHTVDNELRECFENHATWRRSSEPQRLSLSFQATRGQVLLHSVSPMDLASVVSFQLDGCLRAKVAAWTTSAVGDASIDIVTRASPAHLGSDAVAMAFRPEE